MGSYRVTTPLRLPWANKALRLKSREYLHGWSSGTGTDGSQQSLGRTKDPLVQTGMTDLTQAEHRSKSWKKPPRLLGNRILQKIFHITPAGSESARLNYELNSRDFNQAIPTEMLGHSEHKPLAKIPPHKGDKWALKDMPTKQAFLSWWRRGNCCMLLLTQVVIATAPEN